MVIDVLLHLNQVRTQNILDNLCNPATETYHIMIQRITVANHLQRTTIICHKSVADVADGFQYTYNRNALIFKRLDFRCRCVCDSI